MKLSCFFFLLLVPLFCIIINESIATVETANYDGQYVEHVDVNDSGEAVKTTTERPNNSRQQGLRIKRPPPSRDDSFRNVRQPTATAIFGLAPSTLPSNVNEGLEDSGIEIESPDGTTFRRVDHMIKSMPVWNSGGVVATAPPGRMGLRALSVVSNGCSNKPNARVAGKFAQGLMFRTMPLESYSVRSCGRALGYLIAGVGLTNSSRRFIYDKHPTNNDVNAGDVIYVDLVEFRGAYPNNQTQFVYFCLFDTDESEVMKFWSGIQEAIPGGNGKIGSYNYGGPKRPALPVKKLQNSLCQFISADGAVAAYHMQFGTNPLDHYTQQPAVFNCDNGPRDGINGGYGPLADSFYNGVKVVEMLRDSEWGNIPASTRLTPNGALRMAVHFRTGYDNAYWDGNYLYFGDGSADGFYPLGSCVDVVAHEFGHAITNIKAKLVYKGESGCLNEAFSDAVGEMGEAYVLDKNDFLIASMCSKNTPFLRNMSVPRKYGDYFPHANPSVCSLGDSVCQDPHYCSSVPNYIFYKLATAPGWTTQLAGHAWVMASLLFWQPETTLYKAGCDVGKVVEQFNVADGDTDAVIAAWGAGGIDISSCVANSHGKCSQTSESSATTISPTATPRKATTKRRGTTRTTTKARTTQPPRNKPSPKRLENCEQISGLSAATNEDLFFFVAIPASASYQNVQIFGENGDADLYIRKKKIPAGVEYDWAPYWEGSDEWVTGQLASADVGCNYYIKIHASESFNNLDLYACYY